MSVMSAFTLTDFVRESNRIEGIVRDPSPTEIEAHEMFLVPDFPSVQRLVDFVAAVAPGKPLRSQGGMNVYVGSHLPPCGGPGIVRNLELLLRQVRDGLKPYPAHRAYESLHPFMDGNGRSGRALWLWMMGGIECVPLGFLHTWYYQSLEAAP